MSIPTYESSRTPLPKLARPTRLLACAALLLQALTTSANAESAFRLPDGLDDMMDSHCYSCHDEDVQKGDVRLDNLADLDGAKRLQLLDRIQEQVFFKHMPPEKKKQPSTADRHALVNWLSAELNKHSASTLDKKIERPEYGNYVDHEQLFSGEFKHLPGFTYDRDWVISEFIFKEKIDALLNVNSMATVDGERQKLRGNPLPIQITNPFLLPETSGIRYYANEKLNSSHFLTMIDNAKYVASVMIDELSKKHDDYLPAVNALLAAKEKHDAILKSRELYLHWHIDQLCREIYNSEDEGLLPKYAALPLAEEIRQEVTRYRKNGWIGRIGPFDGKLIKSATMRFGKAENDRMTIIRQCEKYWCHLGVDDETISRCMSILARELETILTYDNLTQIPQQKPLSTNEMETITSTIKNVRKAGMSYQSITAACMEQWRLEFQADREASSPLTSAFCGEIISGLYHKIYERSPSTEEIEINASLLIGYASKMGLAGAVKKLTQTILLDSEFIIRSEYGSGPVDEHGRRMLSPRDASYAIAYALTDSAPDAELKKAASEGRLSTREDYKREVERLLAERNHFYVIDNIVNAANGVDSLTNLPVRNVRFFRELFGYYNALSVFKDEVRLGFGIKGVRERLISEADMFVSHILETDTRVFEELLSSEEFYVFHSGDNEVILAAANETKTAFDYFESKEWRKFKSSEDLYAHIEFLTNPGVPGISVSKNQKNDKNFKAQFQKFINIMCDLEARFAEKNKYIPPYSGVRFVSSGANKRITSRTRGKLGAKDAARFYNLNPSRWDYPPVQPAKVSNRKGILTHPAWLQTFSQNTHTDPVTRGKWIREKLLAGTIPDVPIGVEAVIPEDHTKTLRQRLESVTTADECWRCHKHMNPLGNPFESYDDFGRFRLKEELEHPDNVIGERPKAARVKKHPLQTFPGRVGKPMPSVPKHKVAPLDTTGMLLGTGDPSLDGEVEDAHDLIDRLAKSTRVRQSIIRHAFRYFMGRNETLSDSKTLIDADEAYLKSNGSFDAVVVSLLTSDSFIYRKTNKK